MNEERLLLLLYPAGVPYTKPTSDKSPSLSRRTPVFRGVSWLDRYDALVAWMRAHDGALPRDRHKLGRVSSMSEADKEEHRHALWVQKQRRRGQASLSAEIEAREGKSRAELLEQLEGWVWREVESWLSRYDGLVAWMSAHGGAWPRVRGKLGRLSDMSKADAEEHRYAMWMQTQRTSGEEKLSQEMEAREGASRSELLERLEGWVWREAEPWLSRYDKLVAWMSAHDGNWPRQKGHLGRLSELSEADAEEYRNAQWVNEQRRRSQSRLSQTIEAREGVSQMELLERLEGWVWHSKKSSWMTWYNGLVAWITAHDGAWPRQKHRLGLMSSMSEADAEEHQYALWVQRQRSPDRASSLQIEEQDGLTRAQLLERLEGWVWREKREKLFWV